MDAVEGRVRHRCVGESPGFTLMEILIVVSILLIIFFLILLNLKTQMQRANDAKRKTDLVKIQKAFEEIYNDTQCYPEATIVQNCNGNELEPYIKFVPCDPVSHTPYSYIIGTPTRCSGYRLCTKLEDKKDPDIAKLGCDPINGCSYAPGYNYCVSMGYETNEGYSDPENGGSGGSGGPTNTPAPGNYACSPAGVCNSYADPIGSGCPRTFADENCMFMGVNQCDFASNKCPE